MGRHVPRLSFLSVLLSDEEALTPAEDCYHRLLTPGEHDELEFVEAYLKANSLTALYDSVFIPVITAAEADTARAAGRRAAIAHRAEPARNHRRPRHPSAGPRRSSGRSRGRGTPSPAPAPVSRLLPARAGGSRRTAGRDAHAVAATARLRGAEPPGKLVAGELLELVEKADVDAACISVVAPSTVIHARYLCVKLRGAFPSTENRYRTLGHDPRPDRCGQTAA